MKTKAPKYLISLLFASTLLFSAGAQEPDTLAQAKPCETKDLIDYARKLLGMKKPPKEKSSSIFVAPVFGSSPSTGFLYGLTFQGAFKLPNCKMSAFQSGIQYTAKKQLQITLKNNIYFNKNKIFFSGDWSYYDYSQATYGLGTNAPIGSIPYNFYFNDGHPEDSLIQPILYRYFKLHQTVSLHLRKNLFIGPGFHFDRYDQIVDEKLDTPTRYTSHFVHSSQKGFDPAGYTVVGLSLNIVFDSRDNMINPYTGYYANVNLRFNPEWLGSDKKSTSLWTEFRTYLGVSKKRPSKLFAFWLLGNFTLSGDVPYMVLPALGNDQRAKAGRGYTLGRYRGDNMVYGEVEYRFPISKCTNTIGGVIFLNGITTDSKDTGVGLFEYVQPGYGVGLRILFSKKSRMNIQVDYGQGNRSGGIYFGASEVF